MIPHSSKNSLPRTDEHTLEPGTRWRTLNLPVNKLAGVLMDCEWSGDILGSVLDAALFYLLLQWKLGMPNSPFRRAISWYSWM